MIKRRRPKIGFCILFLLLFNIYSCQYEYVEIELPDENIPVSFSTDILPILAKHSCAVCHNGSSSKMDLSAASAYNTIVPNLINTDNPEQSKFYQFPSPGYSGHSHKKYTPEEAAIVLLWINQRAINN